jgi:lysozyme family protein
MTIMPSPRFRACVPLTLAQECPFPNDWSNLKNYSDDAHDSGGGTMCGITHGEYAEWRAHNGLAVRDVRQMTQDEGLTIYWQSYWMPHCPNLPAGLDLDFFDACVNEGAGGAVRILQFVVGTGVDGNWGPQTDGKVKAIADVGAAVRAFTARRAAVYRQLRDFRYFGEDWERRTAEIGAAALKMAA